ncbi:MAG: DUF456 domain-containing protein [Ornithinimicrobium sp.]
MTTVAVMSGLIMLVGLLGIVIPILPGLLLVWVGASLWAVNEGSALGWGVLTAVTLVAGLGVVLQFLIPGQRMRRAGVRTSTLVFAVVVAVILGILIPVVGALIGFPLGIYVLQRVRHRNHHVAWESTIHALKAVGLNIVIELTAALLIITVWLCAIVFGS